MSAGDAALLALAEVIIADDRTAVASRLAASATLGSARVEVGATRAAPQAYYLEAIGHYLYAGDTALHIAGAAYRPEIIGLLLAAGADVSARNRRGAQPLHYAADGLAGSPRWNPPAQAATVRGLIRAGADPNAGDRSGVTPLHRAVRTRCAAAVRALLDGGADPRQANGNGSTPLDLATSPTGRGGSGSPPAKAQQAEIIGLLGGRAGSS